MGLEFSKLLLYLGAPFFAYPYKPFLNHIVGSSYDRAYFHFRRDHKDSVNLAAHCLCLLFQLGNNFALLGELDKLLFNEKSVLAVGTLISWSLSLLTDGAQAPFFAKSSSLLMMFLFFKYRNYIQKNWKYVCKVQAVWEVLAIQLFLINKRNENIPFNLVQFLVLLVVRLSFEYQLASQNLIGSLEKHKTKVNVLVALFMVTTCQDPFGKVPPFFIGLFGWILSYLTNQRWLLFYSGGFLASLAQGVSHARSHEPATLPGLSNTADEFAHATYFPNLLFHSVYESLFST